MRTPPIELARHLNIQARGLPATAILASYSVLFSHSELFYGTVNAKHRQRTPQHEVIRCTVFRDVCLCLLGSHHPADEAPAHWSVSEGIC